MREQPDFTEPFADDHGRAACLAEFLDASGRLGLLRDLAVRATAPADVPDVGARFDGDTPHLRLRSWLALFEDEVREVSDARHRVVHGVGLADTELRAAQWLASHLLAFVVPERSPAGGDG